MARLAADLRMWGGGMMWVRGAADVFESVGARGQVLCLWVWGLSIMGEHGVRHLMKGLLADLDILMNVAGCQSIDGSD